MLRIFLRALRIIPLCLAALLWPGAQSLQAAAHTAEMPFSASISREYAAIVARAVALSALCEEAADEIARSPLAAFVAPSREQRMGLALALLDIRDCPPQSEGLEHPYGESATGESTIDELHAVRVSLCAALFSEEIPAGVRTDEAELGEEQSENLLSSTLFLERVKEQARQPGRLELYGQLAAQRRDLAAEAMALGESARTAIVRRGTQSDPPQAPRIVRLAQMLEALNLYEECLPLLAGESQNASPLLFWADAQAVITRMERAVVLDRANPYLWLALGEALLQSQRLQPALEALDQAVALQPDFARARHARGLLHLMRNSVPLAELDFNTALRLEPEQPLYWQSRAMLYNTQGNHAAMCADMRAACELGLCDGFDQAVSHGYCRE